MPISLSCIHIYNFASNSTQTSPSIMPRGVPISPSKRGAIVEAARTSSLRQVAACWKCAPSTVSRLVACHSSTGSVYPSPKPGRKPKCTRYHLLTIKRSIIAHRFMPLPQLCRYLKDYHSLELGLTTLRRIIHSMGYSRRVARVKPLINKATRSKRLLYAEPSL